MTDKRSPQSTGCRSPKRSKTFPLAADNEDFDTPCRRATASVTEDTSVEVFDSPNQQTKAEIEISASNDEERGSASRRESSLSASRQVAQADTDQKSPAVSEPGTPAGPRDAGDQESQNDSDGPLVLQDDRSDISSDAYVPCDYGDPVSDTGSYADIEDLDEELGKWTAPEEPLRPENPYKKGRVLEIRKHKACAPFGADYPHYEGVRECAPERELRGKTLVELCLDRPPVGGETASDEQPQTLEITDEIRVKEDGGAQLVVCRFSGEQQEVVAKIYDPLYYGFADRMWSDQPRDVTYEADKDYSREVAAFCELDEKLGGSDIPKYHGSWTLQMPLDLPDGRKTRDVRLVLMEHIKGTVMTDLKPEAFPEDTRLDLVARMIEVVPRIHHAGVRHGDISQRNVMVCLAKPDVVERVAMIDFNFAVVSRLDNLGELSDSGSDSASDKPPNPIDRWWGGALYSVAGEWLPESWESKLRPLQEWLFEKYGKSEEYAPPWRELIWDEENVPRRWIAT